MSASICAASSREERVRRRGRRLPALLAAVAFAVAPASSQAADLGPIVYDIVLVRPLYAAHTLAGALVFLPVALQALPGGTVGEAYSTFVLAPLNELIDRPLGEF